jgi:hypothetical protein
MTDEVFTTEVCIEDGEFIENDVHFCSDFVRY